MDDYATGVRSFGGLRGAPVSVNSPLVPAQRSLTDVDDLARFRAIHAAIPVGIVETDRDQKIVDCNKAFAGMLGLKTEEIIGRHGWEFFHPDGPPANMQAVADLLAGRRSSYSAIRLLRGANETKVSVKLDWAAIAGQRGEVVSLACVVTDISDQMHMNAQLQQARQHADVLREKAPIGVVEATGDGVITSVNDAFATMLGYPARDLLGRTLASLSEPGQQPSAEADAVPLRARHQFAAETRLLAADGTSVPVHLSTAAFHDTQGSVSRVASFVVDMTELHAQREELHLALANAAAARDALSRRQRFTETLLETIDVGIVSCDASGERVARNRAERALLGLPDHLQAIAPEQAARLVDILDPAGERVAPDDYPLARALRGESVGDVNFKIGPVGGPHRDVVIRGKQLTTREGTVAGAVVALTDVTAERTALRDLERERGRLAEAQRLGQLGSFTYDASSGQYYFSEEIKRIWGLQPGADLASVRTKMIHPEDLDRVMREQHDMRAGGGPLTTEYRIVRPDGLVRHLRVSVEVALDAAGAVTFAQGTHLDVTDLTVAQRNAQEASTLFEAILTASPDYTFVTNVATGAVVYGSPGKTILGITTEQLERLGPSVISSLVHPDEQPRLRAMNEASTDLADGEILQIRYQARHADGSWHWLSRRVTPFRRDDTGRVVEVLGVVRDVTEVVDAEERLAYNGLHDSLTGLPNRALLMDRLEAALARASQTQRDVAVLFCDLDGFKRINDTAGHAAGDAVLVETATRLKRVLRDHDTVARVGGDEFVIVVEPWKRNSTSASLSPAPTESISQPRQDRAIAIRLAGRIAEALGRPVTVNGVDHVVTASIGIAYAGASDACVAGNRAETILQDADAAMYRAKHAGKDRFEIFEHGLRTDLAERGRVENVLRSALSAPSTGIVCSPREPTLTAAFQPIIDADTGTLIGFEALARLTDANGFPIPPDVFIAIAESTALIRPVGSRMLDLAFAQLAAWRRQHPDLRLTTMAVNVSALQAQHASLAHDVQQALRAHRLTPQDIILELTETALLQAANSTLTTLRQLRAQGVGIAIDDFGTGYASLRYLTTLPVSAVKIDRSFTAGLPEDETCSKIVKAVVGLAADLQLECVVEGVETQSQRDALPLGVQLQGWLTGRPAAPQDVDLQHLLDQPETTSR